MLKKKCIIILFCILPVYIFAKAPASAQNVAQATIFFEGSIVPTNSSTSNMYGINLSNQDIWQGSAPYLTAEDFSRIKSWGLNSVQINTKWGSIEPTPGTYDTAYLARLDSVVQMADNAGLNIVIKLSAGGATWCNFEYLWSDASVQERFYQVWETIANRYKDVPHMKGYALLNEPTPTQAYQSWTQTQIEKVEDLWNRGGISDVVIQRIRAVDPYTTIQITYGIWGVPETFAGATPRPYNNIMYVFSWYSPISVTHEGGEWDERPEWGQEWLITEKLQYMLDFRDAYDVPILAQEVGINWKDYGLPISTSRAQWVDDSLKVLNRYNIGWFYFCYVIWDLGNAGDRDPFSVITDGSMSRVEIEPLVSIIKANVPQ